METDEKNVETKSLRKRVSELNDYLEKRAEELKLEEEKFRDEVFNKKNGYAKELRFFKSLNEV